MKKVFLFQKAKLAPRLKALFSAILFFSAASLSAQTFSGGSVSIPSSGNGTPYPSTINVTGIGTAFTQISVTLAGLSHTFPDDLDILLVGPAGASVILMSDVGGSTDIVNVTYTFADGNPAMSDGGFNASGTYRPTNFGTGDSWPAPGPGTVNQASPTFSVFNGTNANGTWSLFVRDDVGGDSGSLGSWSISFVPPPTNDLCIDAIPIACGESVVGTTIFSSTDNVRSCGPGSANGGVWYTFDATEGGIVQSLSTCGAANFDTKISIYYGDCNRLRCIGSLDNSEGCSGGTTEMFFTPYFGRTHYVLVQASGASATGNFTLAYNCDAGAARPQGVDIIAADEAESFETINLFPNPVQDELNVELSGFTGGQVTMRIHNSLGQVVLQRRIAQVDEQIERINTSNLQSGIYYLTVQAEGKATLTEKFMVGGSRP